MYIKSENLNCIEGKCYVLKRDLICNHGTFTAGSRVRIERLVSDDDYSHCAYSVKSADGCDKILLDREISIERWAEDMIAEDIESTLKYQTVIENFERALQSMLRRNNIKESFYMVLFIVLFVVGCFGIISTLNKVIGFEWVIGMILSGVLIHISNNAYYNIMDELWDSKEQKCHNILASKEV